MERQRSLKSRLSKQNEFEEIEEDLGGAPELLVVATATNAAVAEGGEGGNLPTIEGAAIVLVNNNNGGSGVGGGGGGGGGGGKKSTRNNSKIELPIRSASMDETKLAANREKSENTPTITRQRSHPKVKLLQRSHALRDDTSPPPEMDSFSTNTLSVTSAATLTTQSKSTSGKHHRLGKQGSSHSQGSMDGSSPALSRDSSIDLYTDSSGIDLQQFIVDTLHKNQKDRMLLLKIEQELITLVKDNKRQHFKFPQMSAYQRMLVHRVAAFFGLDHNVDQAGTAVVVNKTKNTRIPDMRFREQFRDELVPDEPKKSILKRDSSSFEDGKDFKSPERQLSSESRRSKSFEEREEEYGKARARIFNQDSSSSQEGAVDSPIRSYDSTHNSSRLSSQEDLGFCNDTPRPWSSTDSDSSNRPTKLVITKTSASTESEPSSTADMPPRPTIVVPCDSRLHSQSGSLDGCGSVASSTTTDELRPSSRRPGVPKASSFGGISVLTRADSATSTRSAGPRLAKAESFSCTGFPQPMACVPEDGKRPVTLKHPLSSHSRVSAVVSTPAATMSSATSPITVATPMTGPPLVNPLCASYASLPLRSPSQQVQPQPVMWAVSNMDAVPTGSILINPHTGQPYVNNDGSIYRHNLTQLPPPPPPPAPPPTQPPPQTPMVKYATQPLLQPALAQQSPIIQQQQQQHQPQAVTTQAPYVVYSMGLQQSPYSLVDQRQFLTDSSGGPGVIDLSNQLSNISFATVPSTVDRITSVDPSILHMGNPPNQMLAHNFGVPAPTARPPSVPLQQNPQQQQQQQQQHLSNMAQTPIYYIPTSSSTSTCSNRPIRYMPQYTYQSVGGGAQPSSQQAPSLMESQQQQQQQSQMVELCHQQSVMHAQMQGVNAQIPAQSFQMPSGQCVYGYPVLGYSPVSAADTYYSVTAPPPPPPPPPSLCSGANSGYTYAMSPLLTHSTNNGGSNRGGAPTTTPPQQQQQQQQNLNHPSHTSYVTGTIPLCASGGRLSTLGNPNNGGGSGSVVVPPPNAAQQPMHPKQQQQQHQLYQSGQASFRPQTPPFQQQQQPSTGSCSHGGVQQRTFGVASPAHSSINSPPTTSATYGLYTQVMNPLPQGYHHQGLSYHHQQQQQQPPQHLMQQHPPAASQTPPLYTTFSPQVVTSLPLFRPGLQMMMKSNTPPPLALPPAHQSFVASGSGSYSAPPILGKGFGIPMVDQRFVKSSDVYLIDAAGNVNDKVVSSPALHSIPNGGSGIVPPPPTSTLLLNRRVPLVQGDLRLIGTPLQHQMQTPLRVPLMLPPQRPMSRLHSPQQHAVASAPTCPGVMGGRSSSNKMRRQQRSKGTYASKVDGPTLVGVPPLPERGGNHILEVQGLPDDLKCSEAEHYLEEIISLGAKLEIVNQNIRDSAGGGESAIGLSSDFVIAAGKVQVYAVFKSESAAQSALHALSSKFELRFPPSSHTPNAADGVATVASAVSSSSEQQQPQQQFSNLQGVS